MFKARKFTYLFVSSIVMITMILSVGGAQPASAQGSLVDAGAWYVATTGNDLNTCASAAAPCLTINGAIGKAVDGDTVNVAIGTYTATGTEVVLLDKSVALLGGWNATFTALTGVSTVDGQASRRGMLVSGTTVSMDRFKVQNGFHSNQGGGIEHSAGTLTVSNSTVSSNSAGDPCCVGTSGGAGIDNAAGTLNLNNSTVSGNTILGVTGYVGSGILNSGDMFVNNSTITGNTNSAGVYNLAGTLTINNATISSNPANGLEISSGAATMSNTILALNTASGFDCVGTLTSLGYNLIGDTTGCTVTAVPGDMFGTGATPTNPGLGALANNGGPTMTQGLLAGSPALNTANPATPGTGADTCLTTDQRGIVRPTGIACDIGAFEGSIPVPMALTPNTDSMNGRPAYKWTRVPKATQYQIQIVRGTKTVFTKKLASSVCKTTTCANTPTNILNPGIYKWRVRALVGGAWRPYSPYQSFTVIGPSAGYWWGDWMDFYVTPNQSKVDNFAIYISVGACGISNYQVMNPSLLAIKNRKFAFGGAFYASGTFDSVTTAHGKAGLNYFFIPGCGYIIGGPFSWTAFWIDGSQPFLLLSPDANATLTVVPVLDDGLPNFPKVDLIQK